MCFSLQRLLFRRIKRKKGNRFITQIFIYLHEYNNQQIKMVVKLQEFHGKSNAGIYALTERLKSGRIQIKIGRSINIKDRLNAYHLCFNSGYDVVAFLPLSKSIKYKKDKMALTIKLEKYVAGILGKSRTYANRKTRGSEWWETTVFQVKKALTKTHLDHPDETAEPILTFRNGFINNFTVEGIKTTVAYNVSPSKSVTGEKIRIRKTVKQGKRMTKIPAGVLKKTAINTKNVEAGKNLSGLFSNLKI
jgi:hypothetical protein